MEAEFGEFELDESYFGARRVRGKRGRGATGKNTVNLTLPKTRKPHYNAVSKQALQEAIKMINY